MGQVKRQVWRHVHKNAQTIQLALHSQPRLVSGVLAAKSHSQKITRVLWLSKSRTKVAIMIMTMMRKVARKARARARRRARERVPKKQAMTMTIMMIMLLLMMTMTMTMIMMKKAARKERARARARRRARRRARVRPQRARMVRTDLVALLARSFTTKVATAARRRWISKERTSHMTHSIVKATT